MATITSAQSGNWSIGSTWTGGVVPTIVDDVTIASSHTVTLDALDIKANSLTINGSLSASKTTSTSLVVQLGVNTTPHATLNTLDIDLSLNPDISCSLAINNANGTAENNKRWKLSGGAGLLLKGSPRKRISFLVTELIAGVSTSCQVSDATGWRVGDRIIFGPTGNITDPVENDEVILTSVVGTTISWATPVVYNHKVSGLACNLTSNVRFVSAGNGISGVDYDQVYTPAASMRQKTFDNVLFDTLVNDIYYSVSSFAIRGPGLGPSSDLKFKLSGCVFYKPRLGYMGLRVNAGGKSEIYDTVCVSDFPRITYAAYKGIALGEGTDCKIFGDGIASIGYGRNTANSSFYAAGGIQIGASVSSVKNIYVCGFLGNSGLNNWRGSALSVFGLKNTVSDVYLFSSQVGLETYAATGEYKNLNIGLLPDGITSAPISLQDIQAFKTIDVSLSSPKGSLDRFSSRDSLSFGSRLTMNSVGNNPNVNISYQAFTRKSQDTQIFFRGATSARVDFVGTGQDDVTEIPVACANGQTIRVVGYVRMDTSFYNGGNCNLPTVSLSGLGATPVTFTAAGIADNWQKYDLSITNNAGYDGNFTLSLTASAKASTSGNVWFDGVLDAPFITKCRHYGFTFNETSPIVTVNPYTVATEAVAAAYTGVTIDATTKRVAFGDGTIDTLNELYDYSQAWGVQNIDKDMPWTRAGALLFLASEWTVVQPAISGVTWGSGTIEWTTPGTISGSFDSNNFRFATEGTYDLSGSTFTGTMRFTNTSGGVLFILVPANIDYVNDDPSTITVQTVVEQAEGRISGIVPGSRLQVYNVTQGVEIANIINATDAYSVSYSDGSLFDAGDVVRVRLGFHSGTTAKLPVQYHTVATTSGWYVLANQQDDTVYNANGIDGDAVTEFIEDFPNVQIDVRDPDGATTVQRVYAWYIAGQLTEDGIRYFHGAMTAEDAINYRINVDVADMHIQNLNTAPLMVTGGRLYRSDGSPAPVAGAGPIQMEYGRAYAVETGVSGLTAAESDRLMQTALQITAQEAAQNAALAVALSA